MTRVARAVDACYLQRIHVNAWIKSLITKLAASMVGCSRGVETVRSLLSRACCGQVQGPCCVVARSLRCFTFCFLWKVTIAMLRYRDCYVRVDQLSIKCTELLCIAYISWCNKLNCCRCESIVEWTAGVVNFQYTKGKVSQYGQCGPAWPPCKEVLQKQLEVTAVLSGLAWV